jgi:RNA polymerase sigma factor (TIGR02999 family)
MKSVSSTANITELLLEWTNGDQTALDKIAPLVESELHRLAHHYMRRENSGHTLQTTALVNEAYIRLIDQTQVHWQNRAHFFAIAAKMMRRILINHARDRNRDKRGGGAIQVSLSGIASIVSEKSNELISLDEALNKLAAVDLRKSQVVEMRYFGGMTVEEVADVLQISSITVIRDWNLAKAWLAREIGDEK